MPQDIIEVVHNPNNSSVFDGTPLGVVNLTTINGGGVTTLNNLSGVVLITGANDTSVSVVGQIITVSSIGGGTSISGLISTGQADLRYYPLLTNPSGYINSGVSGALQSQINNLNTNTGNYYLNSNPNNFVTSGNLYQTGANLYNLVVGLSGQNSIDLATKSNLYTTGSNLDNKINSLSGYSNSNFATITNLAATGNSLQNQINNVNNGTGNFVSASQTGQFYPASNPNNYIRSGDVSSSYATISNLALTGSNLQNQINSLNGSTIVYTTGIQTITSKKAFTDTIYFNATGVFGSNTIDNSPRKTIIQIINGNNIESTTAPSYDGSSPSEGILFNRVWVGTVTGYHGGIYGYNSNNWGAGLVFYSKPGDGNPVGNMQLAMTIQPDNKIGVGLLTGYAAIVAGSSVRSSSYTSAQTDVYLGFNSGNTGTVGIMTNVVSSIGNFYARQTIGTNGRDLLILANDCKTRTANLNGGSIIDSTGTSTGSGSASRKFATSGGGLTNAISDNVPTVPVFPELKPK